MNKEINQMIDNLQFIAEQESASITITQDGCKEILDYITNLEQENEKLKNRKFHIKETFTKRQIEDYKSRCKKAIEYINEHIKYECDNAFNGMRFYSHHLYDFKKEHLLNILTGGDDNE